MTSRKLPTMRIHPREAVVKKADAELREAISNVVGKFDLTWGEILRVVNGAASDYIAGMAKYMIREERHGLVDKPGGLE